MNSKEYMMINKISFSNPGYFYKTNRNRCCTKPQVSDISFSGILDNPQSQRITDANGNTYIIEPGGNIVVHNYGNKDEKKNNGLGENVSNAVTGAGSGALAGNMAVKKSTNTNNDKEVDNPENHEINESDTNDYTQNSETNSKSSIDKYDTYTETDFDKPEYDDSDDEYDTDDFDDM